MNDSLIPVNGSRYQYIDSSAGSYYQYYYKLEAIRDDSTSYWFGPAVCGTPPGSLNMKYLSQNYPNPFDKLTKIQYSIGQHNHGELKVYNLQGELVRTIEILNNGAHSIYWDGTDRTGRRLPAGMYFYELQVDDKLTARKTLTIVR